MTVRTSELALHSMDDTMGPILITTIIGAVLLGMTLMQAFYYFMYPKDILYLKALVVGLVLADAIHLCVITDILYFHLVAKYYDPMTLSHMTWSTQVQALITGMSSSLVQLHYALWIWRASNSKPLLLFTLASIMVLASCNVAWLIFSSRMKAVQQTIRIAPLTMTIHSLSAFVDVMNAASIMVLLRRSQSGLIKSDNLINKMILFIVSTGLLTSLCAISLVVSLAAAPTTLISSAFYVLLGKLYVNSFLAGINARRSFFVRRNDKTNDLQLFTSVQYELTTYPTVITSS
ncbi:hypothetical protein APHAL10511_008052 [Amanita phalloides]|nr:hypothetical protein APHAL10511_008052 [Amanita phalloides]